MARGDRFNFVYEKIKVGQKSFGWKCTQLFPNHNLWVKKSKRTGIIFRESFAILKHIVIG